MEKNREDQSIGVNYDENTDILTFNLTKPSQPGIAEEASDEIWVRFNPETQRILTIDVHNFSKRLYNTFGPSLIYTERTDPQQLEYLADLFLSER